MVGTLVYIILKCYKDDKNRSKINIIQDKDGNCTFISFNEETLVATQVSEASFKQKLFRWLKEFFEGFMFGNLGSNSFLTSLLTIVRVKFAITKPPELDSNYFYCKTGAYSRDKSWVLRFTKYFSHFYLVIPYSNLIPDFPLDIYSCSAEEFEKVIMVNMNPKRDSLNEKSKMDKFINEQVLTFINYKRFSNLKVPSLRFSYLRERF